MAGAAAAVFVDAQADVERLVGALGKGLPGTEVAVDSDGDEERGVGEVELARVAHAVRLRALAAEHDDKAVVLGLAAEHRAVGGAAEGENCSPSGSFTNWGMMTPGVRKAPWMPRAGHEPPCSASTKGVALKRLVMFPARSARRKKKGTPRRPSCWSVVSLWQTCSTLTQKADALRSMSYFVSSASECTSS